MSNTIPKICGKPSIHVPEEGCSECEKLDSRVTNLERRADTTDQQITELQECCTEVRETLDTKADKTEVQTALDTKVDKVEGKGLSTNDFTDADKALLEGIEWTKQAVLDLIGYKEITLEMKATDGSTVTKTVLAKK